MRFLGELRGFMQRVMMAVVGASALVIACDTSPAGPSSLDDFEDTDDRALLNCGNPDQSGNLCGFWRGEVPGRFDQFINRCQRACVAYNAGEDLLRQLCDELNALAILQANSAGALLDAGTRAHCGNVPNRWGNRTDQCIPCDEFARRSDPPQAQEGKVLFFTKASRGWSRIRIWLDGAYIGALTRYLSSDPPGCDFADEARVVATRAPGRYSFRAEDNHGGTWDGTVQIERGGCYLAELTCSSGDCSSDVQKSVRAPSPAQRPEPSALNPSR